jgi:hypothetical protein
MNVDNIKKVIKSIEKEQNHFRMTYFLSERPNASDSNLYYLEEGFCGTTGCIAGHAFAVKNKNNKVRDIIDSIAEHYANPNWYPAEFPYGRGGAYAHAWKRDSDGNIVFTHETDEVFIEDTFVLETAREFMGLDEEEAVSLFYPFRDGSVWSMLGICEPEKYGVILYNYAEAMVQEQSLASEKYVYKKDWKEIVKLGWGVDTDKVTGTMAMNVLQRLIDGEITLAPATYTDEDFSYEKIDLEKIYRHIDLDLY